MQRQTVLELPGSLQTQGTPLGVQSDPFYFPQANGRSLTCSPRSAIFSSISTELLRITHPGEAARELWDPPPPTHGFQPLNRGWFGAAGMAVCQRIHVTATRTVSSGSEDSGSTSPTASNPLPQGFPDKGAAQSPPQLRACWRSIHLSVQTLVTSQKWVFMSLIFCPTLTL